MIIHGRFDEDLDEEKVQNDVLLAFQECQETCIEQNDWHDGQIKLCTSKELFCHHLGLDFSQYRDDQYLDSFMMQLQKQPRPVLSDHNTTNQTATEKKQDWNEIQI